MPDLSKFSNDFQADFTNGTDGFMKVIKSLELDSREKIMMVKTQLGMLMGILNSQHSLEKSSNQIDKKSNKK